ncbi:MAG: hypothetical protein ACRDZS_07935 [Acidimicrobiales bacterium]
MLISTTAVQIPARPPALHSIHEPSAIAVRSFEPDVCMSLTDPFSTVQPARRRPMQDGNGHRHGGDAQGHKAWASSLIPSHARETADQVAERQAD